MIDEERQPNWREVFRMVLEDLIPDIRMFHRVGSTRAAPRVQSTLDMSSNSKLQILKIKFR